MASRPLACFKSLSFITVTNSAYSTDGKTKNDPRESDSTDTRNSELEKMLPFLKSDPLGIAVV